MPEPASKERGRVEAEADARRPIPAITGTRAEYKPGAEVTSGLRTVAANQPYTVFGKTYTPNVDGQP